MKIKILGISGSPRHGNTDIMVLEALKSAENEGAETEFVSLVNKKMGPCISCKKCHDNHGLCFQQDDWAQIHKKFRSSEGVIIGSPVYVGTVTSQLKAFMDRHFSERIFLIENEKYLKPYIGGAIAVGAGRHGGQESTALGRGLRTECGSRQRGFGRRSARHAASRRPSAEGRRRVFRYLGQCATELWPADSRGCVPLSSTARSCSSSD